jgi:hypothetical protein
MKMMKCHANILTRSDKIPPTMANMYPGAKRSLPADVLKAAKGLHADFRMAEYQLVQLARYMGREIPSIRSLHRENEWIPRELSEAVKDLREQHYAAMRAHDEALQLAENLQPLSEHKRNLFRAILQSRVNGRIPNLEEIARIQQLASRQARFVHADDTMQRRFAEKLYQEFAALTTAKQEDVKYTENVLDALSEKEDIEPAMSDARDFLSHDPDWALEFPELSSSTPVNSTHLIRKELLQAALLREEVLLARERVRRSLRVANENRYQHVVEILINFVEHLQRLPKSFSLRKLAIRHVTELEQMAKKAMSDAKEGYRRALLQSKKLASTVELPQEELVEWTKAWTLIRENVGDVRQVYQEYLHGRIPKNLDEVKTRITSAVQTVKRLDAKQLGAGKHRPDSDVLGLALRNLLDSSTMQTSPAFWALSEYAAHAGAWPSLKAEMEVREACSRFGYIGWVFKIDQLKRALQEAEDHGATLSSNLVQRMIRTFDLLESAARGSSWSSNVFLRTLEEPYTGDRESTPFATLRYRLTLFERFSDQIVRGELWSNNRQNAFMAHMHLGNAIQSMLEIVEEDAKGRKLYAEIIHEKMGGPLPFISTLPSKNIIHLLEVLDHHRLTTPKTELETTQLSQMLDDAQRAEARLVPLEHLQNVVERVSAFWRPLSDGFMDKFESFKRALQTPTKDEAWMDQVADMVCDLADHEALVHEGTGLKPKVPLGVNPAVHVLNSALAFDSTASGARDAKVMGVPASMEPECGVRTELVFKRGDADLAELAVAIGAGVQVTPTGATILTFQGEDAICQVNEFAAIVQLYETLSREIREAASSLGEAIREQPTPVTVHQTFVPAPERHDSQTDMVPRVPKTAYYRSVSALLPVSTNWNSVDYSTARSTMVALRMASARQATMRAMGVERAKEEEADQISGLEEAAAVILSKFGPQYSSLSELTVTQMVRYPFLFSETQRRVFSDLSGLQQQERTQVLPVRDAAAAGSAPFESYDQIMDEFSPLPDYSQPAGPRWMSYNYEDVREFVQTIYRIENVDRELSQFLSVVGFCLFLSRVFRLARLNRFKTKRVANLPTAAAPQQEAASPAPVNGSEQAPPVGQAPPAPVNGSEQAPPAPMNTPDSMYLDTPERRKAFVDESFANMLDAVTNSREAMAEAFLETEPGALLEECIEGIFLPLAESVLETAVGVISRLSGESTLGELYVGAMEAQEFYHSTLDFLGMPRNEDVPLVSNTSGAMTRAEFFSLSTLHLITLGNDPRTFFNLAHAERVFKEQLHVSQVEFLAKDRVAFEASLIPGRRVMEHAMEHEWPQVKYLASWFTEYMNTPEPEAETGGYAKIGRLLRSFVMRNEIQELDGLTDLIKALQARFKLDASNVDEHTKVQQMMDYVEQSYRVWSTMEPSRRFDACWYMLSNYRESAYTQPVDISAKIKTNFFHMFLQFERSVKGRSEVADLNLVLGMFKLGHYVVGQQYSHLGSTTRVTLSQAQDVLQLERNVGSDFCISDLALRAFAKAGVIPMKTAMKRDMCVPICPRAELIRLSKEDASMRDEEAEKIRKAQKAEDYARAMRIYHAGSIGAFYSATRPVAIMFEDFFVSLGVSNEVYLHMLGLTGSAAAATFVTATTIPVLVYTIPEKVANAIKRLKETEGPKDVWQVVQNYMTFRQIGTDILSTMPLLGVFYQAVLQNLMKEKPLPNAEGETEVGKVVVNNEWWITHKLKMGVVGLAGLAAASGVMYIRDLMVEHVPTAPPTLRATNMAPLAAQPPPEPVAQPQPVPSQERAAFAAGLEQSEML